jgi:hypothetical protein
MTRKEIWEEIELEVRRSKKNLHWPDHVAAQAGIVCEESGELMRAALNWKYKKSDTEVVKEMQKAQLRSEAIQTAAVAIRFLENLK